MEVCSCSTCERFIRFDDMSTDIQVIEAEKMLMKDTVYDLQGRKVNRSTKKGVYVVNGKKLINR